MISDGQEAWEEAVAGGRGSELGVFLTDSKRERGGGGFTSFYNELFYFAKAFIE